MYNPIFARSLRILAAAAFTVTLAVSIGASAQTEKILYSFTNGADGGYPEAALLADGNGNLYGTTEFGGAYGAGAVFELTPASNGTWTEQVLHSFSNSSDGATPFGGVVFDNKGNLYGSTANGGANLQGTVFELSPGANGVWTEKILYSFAGGATASNPFSSVVLDSAGNIYGAAQNGGSGYGVIYELIPGSNGTWTQKVLHSFANENDGEALFDGTLIIDGAGNLYGVARGGPHDYGIVFELVHGSNGAWAEKILYAFTGATDGGSPNAGLVFDGAGNLYGVAEYAIFELMPQSNGTWTEKVVYTFKGGSDGAYPASILIFDKAGNLYGNTGSGGQHRGTVFKLTLGSNGTWTEKVLHRFASNGVDGISPAFAPLVLDAAGNLYGTTQQGGSSGWGVVYEVTP
jgi:uncharacterized repeat protein (TIGR03803 family)